MTADRRSQEHLDAARLAVSRALETFPSWCRSLGVSCDDVATEKITRYLNGVIDWSVRTGLVSRRELVALVEKHARPSVLPLLVHSSDDAVAAKPADTRPAGNRHVMDLGSGGGFPGAILAALRPEWNVTLLEPTRRKRLFLETLPGFMPNVVVRGERAEALHRDGSAQGRYDLITARAVAPPKTVWPLAEPLLSSRGELHVYVSSADWEQAVDDLESLDEAPRQLGVIAVDDLPVKVMRLARRS